LAKVSFKRGEKKPEEEEGEGEEEEET